MKKYILAFLSMFAICPCPVHGTLLGVAAMGAVKGMDVACKHNEKKKLDKHCDSC